MKSKTGKSRVILRVISSTVLFSIFLRFDSIIQLTNTFVAWGWSFVSILWIITLVRMIIAGLAVLVVLPIILEVGNWQEWLSGYLRIDRKNVLLGSLSFAIFCGLAAVISLSMGIFKGDLSAVFSFPDIHPDPDVIGWGYFLLALVPGIWEELAFRGLIQSKCRTAFSTTTSIFLSSLFFGLYHFSNMVTQAPVQAISGVIMAFFFGIGFGYMTVKARSVIPAIISHYLVDSMGQVFINVDSTNPALTTGFFLLLTLLFPVCTMILTKIMYKQVDDKQITATLSYENVSK